MNKHFTRLAFLSSLILAPTAIANTYVGLNIGQADISLTDVDDTSTSLGGILGYELTNNFAAELFYVNYDNAEVGSFDVNFHALGINLKGMLDFTESFGGYVKVGYANVAIDITEGFTNYGSEDINKPLYGAGLTYAATDNIDVVFDLSRQQTEADDIQNISIGFNYKF